MNQEDLKRRTQQFALRIMAVTGALPSSAVANVISTQLLRSGMSVGANYRAACRARSRPDFISKLGIAIEEADESLYWMELLIESNIMARDRLAPLLREGDEIIAILTASAKTARAHRKARGST